MIDRDEAEQLLATQGHLIAGDGTDLGPLLQVYVDEYTGWPTFATISLTIDRGDNPETSPDFVSATCHEAFVALVRAQLHPRGVAVPYAPATIHAAPHHQRGHVLSVAEEDALFDYYRLPTDDAAAPDPSIDTSADTSGDPSADSTVSPGARPRRS